MSRNHNRSSKGFTLIELLVVIAIIALLLSIVMPALQKTKEKAREVVCRSNLKQWALITALFAEDNDGKMLDNSSAMAAGKVWMTSLRDYYQDPNICLCPSATRVSDSATVNQFASSGFDRIRGYKNKAWSQIYSNYSRYPELEDVVGSYTMNSWAQNPSSGMSNYSDHFWRSAYAKGGSRVPIFMDGMTQGLNQEVGHGELAPTYEDEYAPGWANSIRRVCTDRHNGAINVVFLDRSVGKVGLKGLWGLKWHTKWDIGYLPSNIDNDYMNQFGGKVR